MLICSHSSKTSSMGICSYIHFTRALKIQFRSKLNENSIIPLFILSLKMFGCKVNRLKVTKRLMYSSYCLAAVPTRWVFRASEGMLAQKLATLASTIFLIQWMEIIPTKGICKEASLGYTPTILVHSATPTSSTKRRLLSIWKFVEEQT